MKPEPDDLEVYWRGQKLYGDDFSSEQIIEWFRDEQEAYHRIVGVDAREYKYHALNWYHGFRLIPRDRTFNHILGLGAAEGEELRPLAGKAGQITIVEPSEHFRVKDLEGHPVTYIKPWASGQLPFSSGTFNLITCFGTLHHIPNVSTVVREMARCLVPGEYALVREPIVSMGDWRQPRLRLSRNERGIPLELFRRIVRNSGFEIVREALCMLSLTNYLISKSGKPLFNSKLATALDAALCQLPFVAPRYHARSPLQKLRAVSVFYVLCKRNDRC